MTANLRFGPMLIENFGPFIGKHVFNWERGPGFWFIGGKNLAEPELGANGAGKTTLLVALFWCLFGQTLRNSRPGDRVEPWHGKGTTSVSLGFIRDGKKYVVYRSRKPSKLTLNDKIVTDAEIARLLPPPEVMLYSFVIGQTNTLFLDLKPEPQSQLFTDLLELDLYLDAADRAGQAVKEASQEIEKCDIEIAKINGRLIEVEEALAACVLKQKEYESKTKQQLKELKADLIRLEQESHAIDAAFINLPGSPVDLAKLELERNTAVDAKNAWESRLSNIGTKLTTERANLRQSDHAAAHISGKGTCPTCGQPLARAQHKTLHEQFTNQGAETAQRIEALLNQRNEATEEMQAWQEEINKLNTKLGTLRAQNETVRTERQTLDRQAAEVSIKRATTERQVKELTEAENPHTAQLQLIETRKTAWEDSLYTLETERAESERVHDAAELWQDGFRAIRLSIIDDTLTEVSMAANRHAERLGLSGWQLEFATERETKKGTTSLGFTTFLYPPNVDKPMPWDIYSGGESQRWQLAVSFGLGEVLLARAGITPNIEILDEVTKGLTPEGISDLLQCLSERARETGRTIYMIDHFAIDRGSFDGSLLVHKDENGSEIITQ